MKSPTIIIKRAAADVPMPAYAKPGDRCFDLHAWRRWVRGPWDAYNVADVMRETPRGPDRAAMVEPGMQLIVDTGLRMGFPPGWGLQIWPRSGLSTTWALSVLGGVVDQGYTGALIVVLQRVGGQPDPASLGINHLDRIAQAEIVPVTRALFVEGDPAATERGASGFGSTGV